MPRVRTREHAPDRRRDDDHPNFDFHLARARKIAQQNPTRESARVDVTDILRARAQLKNFRGKDALLRHLSQVERLWEATQDALKLVSETAANLVQFYDSLVEFRILLQSALELLRLVEKAVYEVYFSQEARYDAVHVVLALIGNFTRELDGLIWNLPRRPG